MFIKKIFNYAKVNWSKEFLYRHCMRSIESIAGLLILYSFLIFSFWQIPNQEFKHFVPNLFTSSLLTKIYSFYRSVSQEYRSKITK